MIFRCLSKICLFGRPHCCSGNDGVKNGFKSKGDYRRKDFIACVKKGNRSPIIYYFWVWCFRNQFDESKGLSGSKLFAGEGIIKNLAEKEN